MPAAGDEPAVDRAPSRFLVDVKGLRIVFAGELDDLVAIDRAAAELDRLAGMEILEMARLHGVSLRRFFSAVKVFSRLCPTEEDGRDREGCGSPKLSEGRMPMELHDVMRTTFAAREFTDDPVDDATLYRMLEHARFAPGGGNRQALVGEPNAGSVDGWEVMRGPPRPPYTSKNRTE